jgi:hypothetical protein
VIDLLEVTAKMVKEAAAATGWERVRQRFVVEANKTYVHWQNAALGIYCDLLDAEVELGPLCLAKRADIIGFFRGHADQDSPACPVCDAPARWIPPEEEFDWGLVTVFPQFQVMKVSLGDVSAVANIAGTSELAGLGIEHKADCDVRPASTIKMVRSARQ